jgi:hypothetical protein
MTDELPQDGIKLVVAELLRGHPVVARWEDMEAAGTTPDDWLHEVRDVARRAGVEVESRPLVKVRMTAVLNKDAAAPPMGEIQAKIAQLDIDRKLREADAAALAEDEQ